MKILILEDDNNRINIFIKKLKEHDLDITDNSSIAIEYLTNNNYDYLFLDHDLGGLQNEWNEEDCGMCVVDYLCNLPDSSKLLNMYCVVHSFNTYRAEIMNSRLQKAGYKSQYCPGAWEKLE